MFSDDVPLFSEGPVLVIGSAGVDIVARLRGEPKRGTSSQAQIRRTFGGVARNVAENLARLGQPVVLLAAVGSDETGEEMVNGLSTAGVDVGHVLRLADQPTGTYLAIVSARGALQFALDDMHITAMLSKDFLRSKAELFAQASLVFVDMNLPKDSLRTVFSLARQHDLPVCADPTTASLAEKLNPYLNRLLLVTPNFNEASVLCGCTVDASRPDQAIEAARRLVNRGVGVAIVTLDELGLCYATEETSGHIPAVHSEIIDPTGAGDALTAAVLLGLLNNMPLDEAMRLGVSAAALTMSHPGAVHPELSLQKLYDQLVI